MKAQWIDESHNHVNGLSLLPKTVSTSFNRSLEISSCERETKACVIYSLKNDISYLEQGSLYNYIYRVFLFDDTFLTSSCGRNFEDIDMRFFANCTRRMVVFFSICNMWSFTHYSFLNWKFEKGPILPKNALLCEYWPCFFLTTRL